MWDLKSGKCTTTLKGHDHFCYKACFDNDGISIASVGADKVLNFWDVRNTKAPVFQNKESDACLMSCDFMPNDQTIIATSMEGQISLFSVKRQQRIFFHESIPGMVQEEYERQTLVNTDHTVSLDQIRKDTTNIM